MHIKFSKQKVICSHYTCEHITINCNSMSLLLIHVFLTTANNLLSVLLLEVI